MIISHSFVTENFGPHDYNCAWSVLEDSRLAVLKLRGDKGSLDIFVVYASADSYAKRRPRCWLLANSLSPRASALSIVFGDMNYMESRFDRYNIIHDSFSGLVDESEANDVREVVWDPGGFS